MKYRYNTVICNMDLFKDKQISGNDQIRIIVKILSLSFVTGTRNFLKIRLAYVPFAIQILIVTIGMSITLLQVYIHLL